MTTAAPDHCESPTLQTRREQMFPMLTAHEVEAARRYGEPRQYADGAHIFETGKPTPGLFIVLSGAIKITGRDGHGHDVPITEHKPRQFAGEITQLHGGRAWVDGTAVGETDVLLLGPEQTRKLLIAEAALGEKLMRAFTLRRVAI